MGNPVLEAFKSGTPFTYFHTRVLNRDALDLAISTKTSIEIDLSITDQGDIYIGHPLSFYDFFKIPKPNSLKLDLVLEEIRKSGIFLVLDLKSQLLTDKAIEIVENVGADNCLLHSYANELVFEENIKQTDIEPHWVDENLPLDKIFEVKNKTGVPVVVSCRGLNNEFIATKGEDKIIERIVGVVGDKAIGVSLFLHHDECPSLSVIEKLIDHKLLTLINLDYVPFEMRPPLYLGLSDDIENATLNRQFE